MRTLSYNVLLGSELCKLDNTKKHWEVLWASLVVLYKVLLGLTLCKLCSTECYWDVLCASFVVQSNTGKYFGQAL